MDKYLKTMFVDVNSLSELEYGGYQIRRVEPQYYFYIISPIGDAETSPRSLQGKWTSPREAMAAIDAVRKRK